jgi:hypothetical protein
MAAINEAEDVSVNMGVIYGPGMRMYSLTSAL